MQAMGIQYGSDATAAALDQQYMFGRQLLVAPITTQGATSKNVYLPAGEWYDFWNGGRAQGPGTKSVQRRHRTRFPCTPRRARSSR